MSDETKPVGLWERTKAWADKNRTISGALVGGAAGTIVPGLGTVIGAIVGAGGWICLIEGKERRALAAASRSSKKQGRNCAGLFHSNPAETPPETARSRRVIDRSEIRQPASPAAALAPRAATLLPRRQGVR